MLQTFCHVNINIYENILQKCFTILSKANVLHTCLPFIYKTDKNNYEKLCFKNVTHFKILKYCKNGSLILKFVLN